MNFNRLSAVLVIFLITLFPSAPANADSPKNELVVDISNVFGSNIPVSGKSNSNTLSAESEGIAEFPGTKVTSNALPLTRMLRRLFHFRNLVLTLIITAQHALIVTQNLRLLHRI